MFPTKTKKQAKVAIRPKSTLNSVRDDTAPSNTTTPARSHVQGKSRTTTASKE
jgi:hypothetical protein